MRTTPMLVLVPGAAAEVIGWLNRSLDAVQGRASGCQGDGPFAQSERSELPQREPGGMYLRILVHANEHMGQLVAYAHERHCDVVVEPGRPLIFAPGGPESLAW